jgi:drug/metabolite transporter (DMT)-like permease
MTHRRAVLGLMVVAAVWGVAFTVIKQTLQDMSPMVLLAVRFLCAAVLVAPLLRGFRLRDVGPALLVATLFWAGFAFQTAGLAWTTPARSAFVTGLSTPLTPMVFLLVYRLRPAVATWVGVALAAVGLYFLTRPDSGLAPNRGDLLTLGCAVCFAGQIVATGHFVRRVGAGHLLAVEMAVTGLLSLGAAPLLEVPHLHFTATSLAGMVFLIVTGVATFWFQLRAQQVVSPSLTALIFALEPVFAALTSFVVIGERLGGGQWVGAGLIVVAMVLGGYGAGEPQPAGAAAVGGEI